MLLNVIKLGNVNSGHFKMNNESVNPPGFSTQPSQVLLLAVLTRPRLPSFKEIMRQLGQHQYTNHDLQPGVAATVR